MKKFLMLLRNVLLVLIAVVGLWLALGASMYSPEYMLRLLRWRESDVYDYLHNFPARQLNASPAPFFFSESSLETRAAEIFAEQFGAADLESFLEDTQTQAFIVIQEDAVLYEGYFNGTGRESLATSFSVAKSFTSALVGIAIWEGYIASVNDPVTVYLPELAERDPRFSQITLRHLLLMASGLEYEENRMLLFNGDDPLSTYYPDQRRAALTFPQIVDPPGEYFRYNKYHPQLLGMVLERATGVGVTEYLQTRIWSPIGMEFDGSWSLDSEWNGFEKMETGVNARPIDFARFGRLFLGNGNWEGAQVVPADWVAESTQVDPALQTPAFYQDDFGQVIYNDGRGYYKYMWYGLLRDGGSYDFFAAGDRGQLIYISPGNDLVIVRSGFEYGIPLFSWVDAMFAAADQVR